MTNTQKITTAVCVAPGTTLPAAGNLLAPRCPEPRPGLMYGSQFLQ